MKMGKIKQLVVPLIVLAVLSSPAYASHIASQSFPDMNFQDRNITSAEIAAAETTFSSPGMLPDNPLYFVKRFGERLQLFFTLDKNKIADLHMNFAKSRLAEAKGLAEKNLSEQAGIAIEEFNQEINDHEEVMMGIGKNVSQIDKNETEFLSKSELVLGLVLMKVPDSAKPSIERAINNSIEKRVRSELGDNRTEEQERVRVGEEFEKNNDFRNRMGKAGRPEKGGE